MEQEYSLGNVLKNMTKQQKIGISVFIILVIILLIILFSLVLGSSQGENSNIESTNENESTSSEETVDIDGTEYTLMKETTTDEDGNEVVLSEEKMDEYGNITSVDPELITTYFPYQAVRKHNDINPTLRYYLTVDNDSKTINALIESCDVDGDKALVQEYVNSIPLDLSGYTIAYELFSEDAICEE